ncbi:VOC family protein [Rhodonellum sp.]|uniref:VOC family protein n=1 Tax=Rhodonellum sp. TaxID=2231180 RepID=UPI00272871AB|nr:VOC family protein [Rhodonellum sp.]MDO9554748.1 VOC family protein [Rhodonellum sp.]
MKQTIAQFALVVRDYDEAIDFYVGKLGFTLEEDTVMSETKRWVRIAPPGSEPGNCQVLLAKAVGEEQEMAIGNQTGGRVFLFLHTDDFEGTYQNLLYHDIKIIREKSEESFGTVAVFADLYGNLWDLIQPNT